MTAYLTDLIARHAVVAVFAIMAVDAVLPAGGELTMLFAGALASGAIAEAGVSLLGVGASAGRPAFVVMVLIGTLGYLAGSMCGWYVGRRGGRELIARHGRWLHLGPDRFARAERWFARFGSAAVFLGRLTPLVRSFISIPAGVLGGRPASYAALTFAGSLVWCVGFASLGWALGDRWESVHQAFRYVDYAVVALVVAVLGYLTLRLHRTREAREGCRQAR